MGKGQEWSGAETVAFRNFPFFARAKQRADHTNKIGSVNDFFMDTPYYMLCMQHSFPPSSVRETREGVPGRPQFPSGAVLAGKSHRGANRARDLFVMAIQ